MEFIVKELIELVEEQKKEIENLKQYKKVLRENSVVRSKRIEELEKENQILKTMLESSQANTNAWVKKYEKVAGEIETYECRSCGLIHRTTRDKMTFDLECVGHECYGNMQVINNIEKENDKMSISELTLSAMNVTMHNLLNERDSNQKEIEKLRDDWNTLVIKLQNNMIESHRNSIRKPDIEWVLEEMVSIRRNSVNDIKPTPTNDEKRDPDRNPPTIFKEDKFA